MIIKINQMFVAGTLAAARRRADLKETGPGPDRSVGNKLGSLDSATHSKGGGAGGRIQAEKSTFPLSTKMWLWRCHWPSHWEMPGELREST